jgi:hypothetical protein
MKTNLLFKIIILLLIVSNGFTAFLLLKKGKPDHPPFLSEKIGLTGEQLKKAKNIELSHFDEMKPLEVKIEKLHEELFLSVTSTDKRKVDSLKTAISSFILKKDELLLAHFKKIYALCNPTQKQLFITEIKEHFSRRKHPPRK